MNWLSIIQLCVSAASTIKSILDQAPTNANIVDQITSLSKPVASALATIGGELFPSVKPELQVAAAAMAAFDPNVTKWIQGAMNELLPNLEPKLEVDGIYGAKTRAAVLQFQAAKGLTQDGWAGRVTQGVIDTLLSKPITL